MSPLRGLRTVSSWIALLAILLVTLVPSATGTPSASAGLPWMRICSAANVSTDEPRAPDSPAAPHAFEHCPWCALQADLAPPPDPRIADAGSPVTLGARPVAFERAPRGNATWASAQPRAPPRWV